MKEYLYHKKESSVKKKNAPILFGKNNNLATNLNWNMTAYTDLINYKKKLP